jgi:dTDP-4-amino-4,6-dideoxygalactose transaminase
MFNGFFLNLIFGRKNIQNRLIGEVIKTYQTPVGVYAFTSARGAIAAFLKATNIEGGEVLVSSYTCLAVPTALIAANCIPVYCDIEKNSLNVDIENISKKLNEKSRVIIAQHTLGNLVDISAVRTKINDREVYILEDCALSIGSRVNGQFLGSEGDAAIYSLELSKSISTGWGGILVVKNEKLKLMLDKFYSKVPEEKLHRSIQDASQTILSGLAYQPVFYNFIGKYIIYFGYKYNLFRVSTPSTEPDGIVQEDFIRKLSPIQMWTAKYQWKRLDSLSEIIIRNFSTIARCLENLGFNTFSTGTQNLNVSPRISFLVAQPLNAMEYFASRGIELGRWFDGPLSPLPRSKKFNYQVIEFPNAFFLSRHVVNLPCHSRVSAIDLNRIIVTLHSFANDQPKNKIDWI